MHQKDYVATINEIDELNTRLACGLNALSAIHEAILYGTMEAGEWKDGLYGVYDYMSDIQSQIEKAVNGCLGQRAASCEVHGN